MPNNKLLGFLYTLLSTTTDRRGGKWVATVTIYPSIRDVGLDHTHVDQPSLSLSLSNIYIYTALPLGKSVWKKKRSVYVGVKLSRLYDPAHPFCLLAWHFPFLRTKALLHNDFGKDVEYFSFEVFPSFTFLFYWVD